MCAGNCCHQVLVLALLSPQAALLHDVVDLVYGVRRLARLPGPAHRVTLVQADDWWAEPLICDISNQFRATLDDHGERRAADFVAVGDRVDIV